MEQITNELRKMVKAGIGAVAAGMEKTQETIDSFAKKGEPIYQQAKSAVNDAAGKVKQAVNDGIQHMSCKPGVEDIISKVKELSRDEWEQIRGAVDDFFTQAQEAADEAQQDFEAAPDGAADVDAAEPEKKSPDPMEMAESMRTVDAADNRPEE